MKKPLLLIGLLVLNVSVSLAGGIRTIKANDSKMQPILLRMGKASVLRFSEKPKKVVIGNQNYYSIEFIENDLTIQPLGDVETNLFVYTPYHTYGFILKVCHSCDYDDLVYVKWKSKFLPKKKKVKIKKTPGFRTIGLKFSIDKSLDILVVKTSTDPERSLRMIDLQIENKREKKQTLTSIRLIATRGGVSVKGQGYVVEKDVLGIKETSKARVFLPLKETRGFTLNALWDEMQSKVIIGGKYLQ